jgi:hypothetical protein
MSSGTAAKLAEPVTSHMACGDQVTDAAAIEPGTVVTCPRHGEQEIVREPADPQHTGAFHGFGQHPDFCPGCRLDLRQAAEQAAREHAAQVARAVKMLLSTLQNAGAAVSAAQGWVAELVEAYDVELVEGPDAGDLAHELGVAERALRNAARIAQHRAAMEG